MTTRNSFAIPDWVILSALPLLLLGCLKAIHPNEFDAAGGSLLSFGMMTWASVAILLLDMVGVRRMSLVVLSLLGCLSVVFLPTVLGAGATPF